MTSSDEPVVGVDACPVGWFATVIEDGIVRTTTYDQFSRLREEYADTDRILVDIPIGLPTEVRRRCDEQASDLLGCRGNSVFYPPCESAVAYDDHGKASTAHRDSIGNGLSQQAHNIRDKIQEVADVVGNQYDGLVRESHPELCFAALNGQPTAYSKTSKLGRNLRLELLNEELDDAETVYRDARERYLLKDIRRDDILDSMALAIAARDGSLTALPNNPDEDEPRIYYLSFELPSLTAI